MVAVWTPMGLRQISTPDEEWDRERQKFNAEVAARSAMQQQELNARRGMQQDALSFARETTTPWQAQQQFQGGMFNRELAERQRTQPGWQDQQGFQREIFDKELAEKQRTQPGWQDAAWLAERLQGTFADKAGLDRERLASGERIAGINMGPNQTYADIGREKWGLEKEEAQRKRAMLDAIMGTGGAEPPAIAGLTPEQRSNLSMLALGKSSGLPVADFLKTNLDKSAKRKEIASRLAQAGLFNAAADYMEPDDPDKTVMEFMAGRSATGPVRSIPGIGPKVTAIADAVSELVGRDYSAFSRDPSDMDIKNVVTMFDGIMQSVSESVPQQYQAMVAKRVLEDIMQEVEKNKPGFWTEAPGVSGDMTEKLLDALRRSPAYNSLTGGN